MSYLYSQVNRLEEPHNYMYTPFQGAAFLQSYRESRLLIIQGLADTKGGSAEPDQLLVTYGLLALVKLFDTTSPECGNQFRTLLESGGLKSIGLPSAESSHLNRLAESLSTLTINAPVSILDLLHALVAVQLIDSNGLNADVKVWLGRLIQRFEVTKKLYEFYPAGFRRGYGTSLSIRLYWLFALALCLSYSSSNEIKYLSTLLKVCDLLCSLPTNMLQEQIPANGLQAVLATEITGVQLLAEHKGVSIAPK